MSRPVSKSRWNLDIPYRPRLIEPPAGTLACLSAVEVTRSLRPGLFGTMTDARFSYPLRSGLALKTFRQEFWKKTALPWAFHYKTLIPVMGVGITFGILVSLLEEKIWGKNEDRTQWGRLIVGALRGFTAASMVHFLSVRIACSRGVFTLGFPRGYVYSSLVLGGVLFSSMLLPDEIDGFGVGVRLPRMTSSF